MKKWIFAFAPLRIWSIFSYLVLRIAGVKQGKLVRGTDDGFLCSSQATIAHICLESGFHNSKKIPIKSFFLEIEKKMPYYRK
ncbi:hypothetical protein ES707_12026 [subsurface metagenome]